MMDYESMEESLKKSNMAKPRSPHDRSVKFSLSVHFPAVDDNTV